MPETPMPEPSHLDLRATGRKLFPPLIKWTGSKRAQAPTLAALMPPRRRYIEPFVGGGSMLRYARAPAMAGDAYEPLILLWRLFQRRPADLLANYGRQWEQLQVERGSGEAAREEYPFPSYYYMVRERFNRHKDPMDLHFLLRTCVNGIVRFNGSGEFNSSCHLTRPGISPERLALDWARWEPYLKRTEFHHLDYAQTLAQAEAGDLVYLDPPWAGNRAWYAGRSVELDALSGQLEQLNRRGVNWMMSFDGDAGDPERTLPCGVYRHRLVISGADSSVSRVLNGTAEQFEESVYLNYDPPAVPRQPALVLL